jgi:hypothetical protein
MLKGTTKNIPILTTHQILHLLDQPTNTIDQGLDVAIQQNHK